MVLFNPWFHSLVRLTVPFRGSFQWILYPLMVPLSDSFSGSILKFRSVFLNSGSFSAPILCEFFSSHPSKALSSKVPFSQRFSSKICALFGFLWVYRFSFSASMFQIVFFLQN